MASAVSFFVFGFLVCLISFLLSLFNIRKEGKFSLLNHYPYELYRIEKRVNRLPWFFFCLGLLLISMTGLFLSIKSEGLSFPIGNVAVVLPFLAFLFLTFLSLYREKWHLFAFLAFCLLSLFLSMSYGFYLLTDALALERSFSKVAATILLIIAIAEVCLLANPLLYRYAKMEKKTIDGEKKLLRPKIIWLAFSEWLFLFLDLIAILLILFAVG